MVRRQSAHRSKGSSSWPDRRARCGSASGHHTWIWVMASSGTTGRATSGSSCAVDERGAVEVPRLMVRFVGQHGERDAVGSGRGGDGDDGVGELLEESGEELQAHGGFVGGDAEVVGGDRDAHVGSPRRVGRGVAVRWRLMLAVTAAVTITPSACSRSMTACKLVPLVAVLSTTTRRRLVGASVEAGDLFVERRPARRAVRRGDRGGALHGVDEGEAPGVGDELGECVAGSGAAVVSGYPGHCVSFGLWVPACPVVHVAGVRRRSRAGKWSRRSVPGGRWRGGLGRCLGRVRRGRRWCAAGSRSQQRGLDGGSVTVGVADGLAAAAELEGVAQVAGVADAAGADGVQRGGQPAGRVDEDRPVARRGG